MTKKTRPQRTPSAERGGAAAGSALPAFPGSRDGRIMKTRCVTASPCHTVLVGACFHPLVLPASAAPHRRQRRDVSGLSRCHPSGLNNPCAKTSEAQLLARTSRRLFSSSLRSKYFDAAEPTPPLWHGRRGIRYLCRPMLTPGCGFAVCRRICVRFHQICSGYRWCRGPGPSRCSILGNQVMPTGAGQRRVDAQTTAPSPPRHRARKRSYVEFTPAQLFKRWKWQKQSKNGHAANSVSLKEEVRHGRLDSGSALPAFPGSRDGRIMKTRCVTASPCHTVLLGACFHPLVLPASAAPHRRQRLDVCKRKENGSARWRVAAAPAISW